MDYQRAPALSPRDGAGRELERGEFELEGRWLSNANWLNQTSAKRLVIDKKASSPDLSSVQQNGREEFRAFGNFQGDAGFGCAAGRPGLAPGWIEERQRAHALSPRDDAGREPERGEFEYRNKLALTKRLLIDKKASSERTG